MTQLNDTEIMQCIADEIVKENRPFWIFGGGKFCRRFLSSLSSNHRKLVEGILDDNGMPGSNIEGVPVYRPEEQLNSVQTVFLATDSMEVLFFNRVKEIFGNSVDIRKYSDLYRDACVTKLLNAGQVEDDMAAVNHPAPPLVSVFCFVYNRKGWIKRCIDSILSQAYPALEVVVHDGASTDGTLEVLQEYGDAISLTSAKDKDAADAFWKSLKRCQGKYIACCLSDEEMLPGAVSSAVAFMERHGNAGALIRDAALCDNNSRVTGIVTGEPFDLKRYLSCEMCPHFSTAMFRRDALDSIGLHQREWNPDCGEFELWCRLALDSEIYYRAGIVSKYAIHSEQLSNRFPNILKLVRGRCEIISNLANEHPSDMKGYRNEAILKTLSHFENHVRVTFEDEMLHEFQNEASKIRQEFGVEL